MAKTRTVIGLPLSAGYALLALMGCGTNDASPSPSGTDSELAAAESELSNAVESQDEAQTEAKACFEAFRTCKQATGANIQTCRDTLKTCLPERPPLPPICKADGDHDGDDDHDADETAHDKRIGRPEDNDRDSDETGDEAAKGDAGPRPPRMGERPPVDGGVGRPEDHDRGLHLGHGRKCGRPEVPDTHVRACRDASAANVTTGMELVQAAQAHHACVHKAFSERVATLCEHATKLCTRADADKTICTNMTEACKTAKTPTP